MNEAVMKEKLFELLEKIVACDNPEQGNPTSEGLYVPETGLDTEDVLDHLRVHIKYILFDLEASRRENRYLRQMLEMRPPTPRRDSGKKGDNGEDWQ